MASRATANIIGHVCQDPQNEEYQPTKWRSRFTVAVNRKRGQEDVVDFFRVVAFGKLAETIRDYVRKGRLVSVDCEPQQYRWEEADTKRENVSFFADRVLFLDKPATDKPATDKPATDQAKPAVAFTESTEGYEIDGDDAPF